MPKASVFTMVGMRVQPGIPAELPKQQQRRPDGNNLITAVRISTLRNRSESLVNLSIHLSSRATKIRLVTAEVSHCSVTTDGLQIHTIKGLGSTAEARVQLGKSWTSSGEGARQEGSEEKRLLSRRNSYEGSNGVLGSAVWQDISWYRIPELRTFVGVSICLSWSFVLALGFSHSACMAFGVSLLLWGQLFLDHSGIHSC